MPQALLTNSIDSDVSPKHRVGYFVSHLKSLFYSGLESPRRIYRRTIAQYVEKAQRVLDIGCGYKAPDLETLHTSSSVLNVGTDIVGGLCPAGAPSVRFVEADCRLLPFPDSTFELVVCRDVIEHLEDPLPVFREVARLLTPGGAFVFLTPNRWDYVSLGASTVPNYMHGKIVLRLTGRDEEETFPTLFRANSARRIRSLAVRSGLQVAQIALLREHPHYLKINSFTYMIGIAFEQGVQRMLKSIRPYILGVCQRDPVSNIDLT